MFSKVKITDMANSLLNLADIKLCTLSQGPLGDCMMPCAEVQVRVQASHKNILVLSHLNHTSNNTLLTDSELLYVAYNRLATINYNTKCTLHARIQYIIHRKLLTMHYI